MVQPVLGISYKWADILWPFMSASVLHPLRLSCALPLSVLSPSWRNPFLLVQQLGGLNDIPLAEGSPLGPGPHEALKESPSPHESWSFPGSALRTGPRVICDTSLSMCQALAAAERPGEAQSLIPLNAGSGIRGASWGLLGL